MAKEIPSSPSEQPQALVHPRGTPTQSMCPTTRASIDEMLRERGVTVDEEQPENQEVILDQDGLKVKP